MVEIAMAIGVIGFALVAIVGILPYGLNAQRDNRADTLISQDASYFLEAIRNGRGSDEMAKCVESVTVTNSSAIGVSSNTFYHASDVVKLLSWPKFQLNSGTLTTNVVRAHVFALSSAAVEQGGQSQVAFDYMLQSEITPFVTKPGVSPKLENNLWDVKLTLSWPYRAALNGHASGRQVVRTMVSGQLVQQGTGFVFKTQQYQ